MFHFHNVSEVVRSKTVSSLSTVFKYCVHIFEIFRWNMRSILNNWLLINTKNVLSKMNNKHILKYSNLLFFHLIFIVFERKKWNKIRKFIYLLMLYNYFNEQKWTIRITFNNIIYLDSSIKLKLVIILVTVTW